MTKNSNYCMIENENQANEKRSACMKSSKDREKLISTLSKFIPVIMEDSNSVHEISTHLSRKYNIDLGRLMYFFNNPARLEESESAELALIAEQIGLKLNEVEELKLSNWFNINEIKEIRQFYYVDESKKDKLELPLVFENVAYLGDGVYQVPVEFKTIARMYKYDLLNYNFEIQREGRLKRVGNEVIQEMKVYKKNVNEIKERVLQGKLKKTALAYNCATDTSEDETEQEIIYNDKEHTLTITNGTRIDILDGAHRTMGIYEAYMENADIEGKITVLFSNYTTAQAREYQVELAKATPFNKARAEYLARERKSDILVDRLRAEGMLRGNAISTTSTVNRSTNQYTTARVLSNAFDKHWKPEKPSQINKIMTKFNEYLDILFEYYDEYKEDTNNLLFSKLFFIGHVILAKSMLDKNIPYEQLNTILDEIDFSKDNPMWKELNIVKTDGITNDKKTIKGIEGFFKNLI